MRELEKILEEIKDALKDTYLDIANNYDVSDLRYDSDKVACVAGKFRHKAGSQIENIIRKHMNDGWIPVEGQLPDGETRVICQFDNGDIELLWQDWESDLETLTYFADFSMMATKKVVAWRPLPESYHPEPKSYEKRLRG